MTLKSSSIFLSLSVLLLAGCSRFGSKPAGLSITTNAPATVTMDEKDLGATPFNDDNQKAGKYTFKIIPTNGVGGPHETALKLFAGYKTQIEWNFGPSGEESYGVSFEYEDARDKNKVEVQVTASPDNVPVVIDGQNVGFTPLLVDTLSEGDHSILLQAPGYDELTRTVKLVKGVRTIMTGKLAKQPQPTPLPIDETATASAEPATASAKKIAPTPTPKATVKPATGSATAATPTPVPSTTTNKPTTTTKPYVEILSTTTGWLRVRETADATGKELTKLDSGSTVPYANASASGWLKVKYDGTAVGWVSSDYAKLVQ